MLLGRSALNWIVIAFVACVVFLLGLELIPLLFGLIDITLTRRLVRLLSLLIAVGIIWYGGWGRGA